MSRRFRFLSVLFSIFLVQSVAQSPLQRDSERAAVSLILDTDIGNDIDDAIALAVIHALENRGEVHLLAVTITKDNPYCAPFVDLLNTFYGRSNIPIGVVRGGKTPAASPMIQIPVARQNSGGRPIYPHRVARGDRSQDAVQLLTQVLSRQADRSVTVAQIGFSTNLARLLQSPGGAALVKRKVKALYLMAGNFARPEPEYNVYTDPESAKFLFEQWPTPMVFSGFEVGLAIPFPYSSIQHDFGYVANHPVAESYRIFLPSGEDRPLWDPTAVLESIRPDRRYFDLSPEGRVKLGPNNTTVFIPDEGGRCRYLIMKSDQIARVREAIVTLASEPPLSAAYLAQSQRLDRYLLPRPLARGHS